MAYKYVGTIVSAGATKNNQNTTGTPFTLYPGRTYYVQPDVAGNVASGAGAATAATANDVAIDARAFLGISMSQRLAANASEDTIAWLGNGNLRVYEEV